MAPKRGYEDDDDEEEANRVEEEENEKDKKTRRKTRAEQRDITDALAEKSADIVNNVGLLGEIIESLNATFSTITNTREQLGDAVLFRIESQLISAVAAKMDDVSR